MACRGDAVPMPPSILTTLSRAILALGCLSACSNVHPPDAPPSEAMVRQPDNPEAAGLGGLPSPLVVSVLSFEDRTNLAELRWLRRGLADLLTTDLSRASGVQMVQRERLDAILREQALQAGGPVADRTAVRIGHLTGATVILAGSVARVGDRLRMDAHLLDVERGTVIAAVAVEGGVSDLLGMEKQLAARILALFDAGAGDRPRSQITRLPTRSQEAAAAHYEGLEAAERGDVASALDKFEAALGKDPRYEEARRDYERALLGVDTESLWARASARDGTLVDRQRVAARLADDFLRQGIRAEMTTVNPERGPVGTRGRRIGVTVFFAGQALLDLRQAVGRLGGSVEEEGDLLLVRASADADVHAAFAQAVALPRRLFLHIVGPDGRRLAVYSQFRQWRGAEWVAVGPDGRVVVHGRRRVFEEISLAGLPSEGLADRAQIRGSLEPVPREQAVLQAELVGTIENGREMILSPRPQGRSGRAEGATELWEQRADEVRTSLERWMEGVWNPPVWERVPGPGYLPSARRSALVAAVIQAGAVKAPKLVSGSGDPMYDAACVKVVTALDQAGFAEPLALLGKDGGPSDPLRLRVHCDLLKDTPPLHVGE